jgi:hypothetical protein
MDALLMTCHVPAVTCGSPAAQDFFWVQLLDAVITTKGYTEVAATDEFPATRHH